MKLSPVDVKDEQPRKPFAYWLEVILLGCIAGFFLLMWRLA